MAERKKRATRKATRRRSDPSPKGGLEHYVVLEPWVLRTAAARAMGKVWPVGKQVEHIGRSIWEHCGQNGGRDGDELERAAAHLRAHSTQLIQLATSAAEVAASLEVLAEIHFGEQRGIGAVNSRPLPEHEET